MSPRVSPLQSISDTAYWAAVYRARENERSDALFRDPFARRLAGTRGDRIADTLPFSDRSTWAWIVRTYLFDQFVAEKISRGVDTVVNLAAGLDTRPYRMSLPPSLRWIEIDLPAPLNHKVNVLQHDTPGCEVERLSMDLSDVKARREVFAQLGRRANDVLVLAEGLIIYLAADEVAMLARDLAAVPTFRQWALDLASPGLLRMLQKKIGSPLNEAGAPLRFGPEEGPGFFAPHGWRPVAVRSLLKTAASLRRLSFWMRWVALLPESAGCQGARPWSAVCLMGRP